MKEKTYKKESKSVLIIHTILAIIMILFLNKGIYTYIDSYIPNIVIIAIFGIWMIISLLTNNRYIESLIKILIPLIFFMLIIKISSFYTNNVNLDMYLSNLLYILMLSCIAIYYIDLNNKKINKVILIILLIDTVDVGINTYIQLLENPLIARFLTTGIETRSKLVGNESYLAVGNYTYFYSLVMIILALINYVVIKKDDGFSRIIVMILIIFLVILTIQAQFMISILLLAMCTVLMIINNALNKSNNKKLVLAVTLIIFMVFIIFLPNILKGISNLENIPDLIKVKLEEIYNTLMQAENTEDTDLNSRFTLYSKSLGAFINNIFIGTFGENEIGEHSTWLDMLGLYGLFSMLLFIYLLNMYRFIKKRINPDGGILLNITWLYVVILGIINTLLFSKIFLTLFIIVPLSINLIYDNDKTYKKNKYR